MKISYNWLKNYLPTQHSPEQLSSILTATGLEVEAYYKANEDDNRLDGLVVGEVVECEKHPNADTLSVTKVNIGEENLLSIVCGAPNVAKGQKVVVATVGATLYPTDGEPFKIKKSKLRGELSEGMLCAEDEIGLGESHAGIMVLDADTQVGMPVAQLFKSNNDYIFEIGLTPNRTDAMSHIGVARDIVAALNAHAENKVKVKKPPFSMPAKSKDLPISITIENTEACPRYSGVVIDDVSIAPSPEWLQEYLKAVGVRPINNVVDITNFVLKEMGQPLHAFDYNAVKGNKVVIKTLPEDTEFITLDGQKRKLKATDLMICNESEGMCMAGVFGGEKSGVSENTTAIFLESAYFNSSYIRKTSTHHELRTDAATRYEKGADPNITIDALKRAATLICEFSGGKIASEIIDVYPEKIENFEVELRYIRLENLTGISIAKETVKQILADLEIEITHESDEKLLLSVPPFKADVHREADVIEEILRIYGFDNVPIPSIVKSTMVFTAGKDKHAFKEQISFMLNGFGFTEIMTNSISKSALYEENEVTTLVKLQNSMTSELDVMRGSLLPDGLEVLAHNINRKNANLKMYEFGSVYKPDYSQEEKLVLFATGNYNSGNWKSKAEKSGFFHLKGAVDALLGNINLGDVLQEETKHSFLDYGINYQLRGKTVASIGAVASTYLQKADVQQQVFYAELDFESLYKMYSRKKIKFTEIPKFPSVLRDLAVIIDEKTAFADVKKKLESQGGALLKKVELFDIYRDEQKIGAGKKSYALSFTLLDEKKTLTDIEIDKIFHKLMRTLENDFQAIIRK